MDLFEARTPFFVTLKGNPPKRNTTNLRVPLRTIHARIEHRKDCFFFSEPLGVCKEAGSPQLFMARGLSLTEPSTRVSVLIFGRLVSKNTTNEVVGWFQWTKESNHWLGSNPILTHTRLEPAHGHLAPAKAEIPSC